MEQQNGWCGICLTTGAVAMLCFLAQKSCTAAVVEILVCYHGLGKRRWNYMNDCLRCNVFIRYHPETIACACIYLAARELQIPLPTQPAWYAIFDVEEAHIQDICLTMLKMYSRSKPNPEELEKSVNEVKKVHIEAKLRAKSLQSGGTTPNSRPVSPASSIKFSPHAKKIKSEDDRSDGSIGSKENHMKRKRHEDRGSGSRSRSRSRSFHSSSRSRSRSSSVSPTHRMRHRSPHRSPRKKHKKAVYSHGRDKKYKDKLKHNNKHISPTYGYHHSHSPERPRYDHKKHRKEKGHRRSRSPERYRSKKASNGHRYSRSRSRERYRR